MKRILLSISLSVLALGGAFATVPHKQDDTQPATRGARMKTIDYVIATMSKGSGQTILVDTAFAGKLAPMPKDPSTPANIEAQLDEVVKGLPRGTSWAKVMLPAPASGRVYRADDVAEFVFAQAKLFGKVGASTDGIVEVLGQKLNDAKATPVVATLNLKPYYLITNPTQRIAARNDGATRDFAAMSPEDQASWAADMAAKFKANPQAAQQFMQQGMMVMRDFMSTMSPQERQQFFQQMGPMLGGLAGPGGFPGRPGGGQGGGRPPQ